jgi:preprotein translocase subunit YajC
LRFELNYTVDNGFGQTDKNSHYRRKSYRPIEINSKKAFCRRVFSGINVYLWNFMKGYAMNSLWILAEATPNTPAALAPLKAEPVNGQTTTSTVASAPNTPVQPVGATKPQPTPWSFYAMMAAMMILLYFMMIRGPKKKQQQQKQMIQSLKKNDRVQTIGGILGTVLDVKDDEVTLKVDETNNTKIRVVVSAIGRVLSEEKK